MRTILGEVLTVMCLIGTVGMSLEAADSEITSEGSHIRTKASVGSLAHDGTGTDVRSVRWGRHGSFERVVFEIYEDWHSDRPLSQPEPSEIRYETHPYRLTVRLRGVWTASAAIPAPRNSIFISGIHRIPSLERSGSLFAIYLKRPVAYKVQTFRDPARIVIDISEQEQVASEKAMFSLRTLSYRPTTYRLWETLTNVRTILSTAAGGEASIIQSSDDTCVVQEGLYATPEEAEARRQALIKEGYRLHVEKRGPAGMPGALF